MKYKYRNNLVRATLSVFAVCTLLYIASSSAHSSTQLNSPAPTPEFSDAPVSTSHGPLPSEDITRAESYTLEVITQGTATHEAPTMVLAQMESAQQPQLATPELDRIFRITRGSISIVFMTAAEVGEYDSNLYLGDGTNREVIQRENRLNNASIIGLAFLSLEPGTQYTIEVIAKAADHRDSAPLVVTLTTEKANINPLAGNELVITESTDNITVSFQNTPMGVDGYALSIRERFDNFEIAQSTQEFTIAASPVTFTDLVLGRAYTLLALPTFNSGSYEYTGGIVSLDFRTLAQMEMPKLNTPVVKSVSKFSDVLVLNVYPVPNAEHYIVKLYLGDGTNGEALQTSTFLQSIATFLNFHFSSLVPGTEYTMEVIARAEGYRDSNAVTGTGTTDKVFINPPTASQLVINSSTDNITVTFEDTPMGVDGYALSIRERFGDEGLARSEEDFLNAASPVTFTGLVLGRAYTLLALPTFNSGSYEYTGGIVSLDFRTIGTSLPLRLRVFLEGPLQ